jgi:hypothetical protein
MITIHDFAGYTAALMMLLTFLAKDKCLLRILAIFTNMAFLTYGILAWLPPVICLHVVLFPINVFRLTEMLMPDGWPAMRAGPHRQDYSARSA